MEFKMNIEKSKETLEKLLEMSPQKRKEFVETDEFMEARKTYEFFPPIQRKMYGKGVTRLLDGREY
jgi:protein associated with RNAse G/E